MLRPRSLPRLLDENKMGHVGYMTVDLEGGEPQFLRHFDFGSYRVDVLQVECNAQASYWVALCSSCRHTFPR